MSNEDRSRALMDYYAISLQSLWQNIKVSIGENADQEAVKKINDLLGSRFIQWNDVYLVEQLMVQFMPQAMVDAHMETRLIEARNLGLKSLVGVEQAWKDAKAAADNLRETAKRDSYLVMLDELHGLHTKRWLDREIRTYAAQQLWRRGLAIMVIVALPWIAFVIISAFSANVDEVKIVLDRWLVHIWAFGLYTAVSFGLLGAFFSRLNSFQSQAETLVYGEMTPKFRSSFLKVRFIFGMVGALILYFLMAGGFLEGTLFPKLEKIGFTDWSFMLFGTKVQSYLLNQDAAKLIVWSFIGGFSERLVPSTLERSEATATTPSKQDK